MMNRLVPKIFYADLDVGRDLFGTALGFTILHDDGTFAVVERDGAKAYLVEDAEYAAKDRPEIAIETDRIHALYEEIAVKRRDLLHPNGRTVERKPWGMLEFALLDSTGVCIVFRQF
jgi:hypothetical protein